MNKKLFIIGAGGHAKVVGEIALLNGYTDINFFDDNYLNIFNYPFPIKGELKDFQKTFNSSQSWFVAIGDNKSREDIINKFDKFSHNLINLFHPSSIISKFSHFEQGICVMANAVVNAGSKIKKGSVINTSSSVDHDCFIDSFAHIGPNVSLSGNISVGKLSFVGTGSSVHPGIKIGKNVKIGVGSKVYKDIADNTVFKN